jgi:hypothetical protein
MMQPGFWNEFRATAYASASLASDANPRKPS